MSRRHTPDDRARYWHPDQEVWDESPAGATLQLVAERVHSFRQYNTNRLYRLLETRMIAVSPDEMAALSGLERGHDYTCRPSLVSENREAYLITAPRVPDKETDPLVDGLGAWSVVARYGRQTELTAFDWDFYLPASQLNTFRERVVTIGGRLQVSRVDLATIAEKFQEACDLVARQGVVLDGVAVSVSQVAADKPELLAAIHQRVAEVRNMNRRIEGFWQDVIRAQVSLAQEFGRLAEKAQAEPWWCSARLS